jgi:two-component system sensor histidine kinase UhpB
MTDVAATRGIGTGGLGAEYFARLVIQLPIVVWSTDRDLHLTSRHGGLLATFGLEAGAGDGQHVAVNIDPDGRAPVIAAHQTALAGESASYETSFRGRTFSAHVDPLVGPGGAIVGVVGFAFDVTDRRRAETALRESEQRFAMAFHANPAPLVITTLGDGKVLDANDAFLRLLDRPREEVIGETTIALGVIDCDRRVALTRLLREGGTVGDIELSVRRRSGSTRDVVLSLVRIELGGEACTLGIYRDVTEGKRAEEQLRASRAALRGLATRQQDVREDERARIAREIHDSLGQALTALKLDLAAAREAAQHGSPGLVERLGETAQMVDDLVKGVRRIATELRPPILDELGLPAAVEWLARDFTRRSGLVSSVKVHPTTKPIAADLATALFRILQEALTNISRHAAARRVEIDLSVKSDVVTLEISDDGRGITEAGASGPGSLGILGMRERAAALGGVVEVGPRPDGVGTRVAAWFPRQRRTPVPGATR